MNKKDFLIIIAGLIILVIIVTLSFLIPRNVEGVKVNTDGSDYSVGDKLRIKIENNLEEKICFSSCYPYYFEKNEGAWNNYRYKECPEEDIIYDCVDSNKVKAFELEIPTVKTGIHRIALPACIGCSADDLFNENNRFYSNDFNVK
ncbi:hypothetical protein KKC65_03030 [Patescibacteria group bacterium]|nr:hypothetical protein [Patescibacteria group bacterium]